MHGKEEIVKTDEMKCCGDESCCMSANEVDTTDCSQQDADGNCCGDESRCAQEFGINEENCAKSLKK